jgi:hypothetical protein
MVTLYKDGKEANVAHAVDVMEWEKEGWSKIPPQPKKEIKSDKLPNKR